MRVLHVTHRLPPDGVGGVERYVETVADELAAQGAEVAILTRSPRRWPRRPVLVEDVSSGGIRVFRVRGAGVRLENFLVASAATEELAARALAALRPDVVHVHHLIGFSPRVVSMAQREGAAVVLTLHDYYFPCPLVHLTKTSGLPCSGPNEGRECARTCFRAENAAASRWLLRYRYFGQVLALPERVVCPNADLAARVRAMAPSAHVEVAPLGIEVLSGSSARRRLEAGAVRLGFFGTVAPHKGLGVLLDALAQLKRPVDLFVAGPSPDDRYRRSLRRRAVKAGLHVEWRGAYEPAELANLLADVDVVVAPSQVPEVFPLAVREALAHGVPVVAASQPGLADVVVHEVNGLLFAPGEAGELAACIERLGASPAFLAALSAGAESTARFSQTQHVEDLRALYAQVVDGPRAKEDARVGLDRLHDEALAAGFADRSGFSAVPARRRRPISNQP